MMKAWYWWNGKSWQLELSVRTTNFIEINNEHSDCNS